MGRLKFPKMPGVALGIYPGEVYLATSRGVFNKAARYFGDGYRPKGAGCVLEVDHPRMGRVYLVGVFDKDICTLQHECNHVALDVVDHVNFDAHAGNGEPFCYLSEMIFKSFHKRFLK